MARGWESKAVEAQQDEAARAKDVSGPATPEERARLARRTSLEMSLRRARADLESARQPAHRAMLEAAVEALERQLAELR